MHGSELGERSLLLGPAGGSIGASLRVWGRALLQPAPASLPLYDSQAPLHVLCSPGSVPKLQISCKCQGRSGIPNRATSAHIPIPICLPSSPGTPNSLPVPQTISHCHECPHLVKAKTPGTNTSVTPARSLSGGWDPHSSPKSLCVSKNPEPEGYPQGLLSLMPLPSWCTGVQPVCPALQARSSPGPSLSSVGVRNLRGNGVLPHASVCGKEAAPIWTHSCCGPATVQE